MRGFILLLNVMAFLAPETHRFQHIYMVEMLDDYLCETYGYPMVCLNNHDFPVYTIYD